MRTIATNSNNDLYIAPNGQLAINSDLSALSQVCENAVKTMMGELVLQGDTGVPNFQLIWGGAPNIAQAENAIRETLMGVTGVEEVTELSAFVDGDVFKYTATIKTIYGEASLGV